jgi:hypothetical protein
MDDSDVANAIYLAKKLGITIHVRGTDSHPVVEFKHKWSGKIVGGIELKRLMERLKRDDNT